MDEKKVSFLPFHAINEFMTPEYRLMVVRSTLEALPDLAETFRAPVDRLTRKYVQVTGFRNSLKAPLALKVRPLAAAYEKNPELVAAVISAWAEAHNELRSRVYDLLKSRNWEILPADTDRAKLPGFLTKWPKGEDFAKLNQAYAEMYPQNPTPSDDVSLMVVWLSGRLPYEMQEDEKETSG
jgi:hypothetical protein